MRELKLAGTDIITTPVGFGCGRLLRITSAAERRRLLDAAYDAGIRHFDLARLYGLGAAESELGRFARGRRDSLVLATKFGLDVNRRGAFLARCQGLVRRAAVLLPALGRIARRRAGVLLQPRRYDAAAARDGLQASLRALGTDYVDLFLLHEPSLEELRSSDVLSFLTKAQAAGRIRAYGVSGPYDDVAAICRAMPELAPVAQFPSDTFNRNADRFDAGPGRGVVTFSALASALEPILRHVGSDEAARRRWRAAVGRDCALAEEVAHLLLHYAVRANPRGVVVCSTTRPERVGSLAEASGASLAPDPGLPAFLELVSTEVSPGAGSSSN